MGAALLLRGAVRRCFGAAAVYGLWCLPALRLVVPLIPWSPPVPTVLDPALTLLGRLSVAGRFGTVHSAWVQAAAIVWLGGVLLRLALDIAQTARFISRARRAATVRLHAGRITIFRSRRVDSPVATGIIARRIFLPVRFLEIYDWQERHAALLHELMHYRRGDLVANALARLVLALHWWNPLAYLAYGAFREDQELACDASVVVRLREEARLAYGRAIVKAALGAEAARLACGFGGAASVRRRTASISVAGSGRSWPATIVLGVAVLACLALTGQPNGTRRTDIQLNQRRIWSAQDVVGAVRLTNSSGCTPVFRLVFRYPASPPDHVLCGTAHRRANQLDL